MYRKENIEKNLLAIESDKFQHLCKDYIHYKLNSRLQSISAVGSQLGKRQTIRGVPDIYFYVKGEKYSFIEVTTQQTDLQNKFISDIEGCIKKCNKEKISPQDITSIILFFNSRANINIESNIRKAFKNYEFDILFYNIDFLTTELLNDYTFLAEDYLGVRSNRGQIVPVNYFIEKYNTKQNELATPINNPFYSRVNELEDLEKLLEKTDIIILKGQGGVGKTKLATHLISRFIEQHTEYNGYVIGKIQYQDVLTDLLRHIDIQKNIILLIDDANQKVKILEYIKNIYSQPEVNLKLILTVRSYAYDEIVHLINQQELDFSQYTVNNFLREDIINIISHPPFLITHPESQEKIIEIAKGNPRLAIMGAIGLNQNPKDDIFTDTLTLYDKYFNRVLSDLNKSIDNKILIKVLGIVAAFNTIKLLEDDTGLLNQICEVFNLEEQKFIDTLHKLEEKELLEIHSKYHRAKITEQIVYTYFFYKLFIKDELLSFDKLLEHFYPSYFSHISYLIKACTDSFGKQENIQKGLKNYYTKIKNDTNISNKLFENHWLYLMDELILKLFFEIKDKKEIKKQELYIYDSDFRQNQEYFLRNAFNILLNIFSEKTDISNEYFQISLTLIFDYIKRFPEKYNNFIDHIRIRRFSSKEKYLSFFSYIIEKREDLLSKSIFIRFINGYLSYFQSEYYLEERKKAWEQIFYYFDKHPIEISDKLLLYITEIRNLPPEILNFDWEYIYPFVTEKILDLNFAIKYQLNNSLNKLEQKLNSNTKKQQLECIKNLVDTDEYKYYQLLKWNTINRKPNNDLQKHMSGEEYRKMKKDEILNNVSIQTDEDLKNLLQAIKNSFIIRSNYSELSSTLSIILNNVVQNNLKYGIKLIKKINKEFPKLEYILYIPINNIKTQEDKNIVWEYIENLPPTQSLLCKFYFFKNIPDEFLSNNYVDKFLVALRSINEPVQFFYFHIAERFINLKPDIIDLTFETIIPLIEKGTQIYIFELDMKKSIPFITNIRPIELLYLNQTKIDEHFDSSSELFIEIFKQDSNFLISYIKHLTQYPIYQNSFSKPVHLAEIWNSSNIEALITELILTCKKDRETDIRIIIESKRIRLNEKLLIPLFCNLNQKQKLRAVKLLKSILKEQYSSEILIDIVITIARCMGEETFKQILHQLLDLNISLDIFKKLELMSSSATISGGTFGDVYANRWEKILSILKEYKQSPPILLINFVQKRIEYHKNEAEKEREDEYAGYR